MHTSIAVYTRALPTKNLHARVHTCMHTYLILPYMHTACIYIYTYIDISHSIQHIIAISGQFRKKKTHLSESRLEVDQQGQMSDAAALKILNRLNSESGPALCLPCFFGDLRGAHREPMARM